MKKLIVVCLLIGCHAPPVQAKEPPTLQEANKLFDKGQYDAALAKYDDVAKRAGDERLYTRAMFRAVECETLLYRHEQALDRVRAAKLPADAGLRAIVELGRLEMFRGVENWYGFSDETEEGAQGSAKLSRAAVARETEAAGQALWKDRDKLSHLALDQYADFFVLTDADLQRYPSLWDFAVLRMEPWLRSLRGRTSPLDFAAADYPRAFDASRPGLARLGALYDESAHLDGGGVDRSVARDRWRVARVGLGSQVAASEKERKAWRAAAIDRLRGWSRELRTQLGRSDAALHAAQLLFADRRVEALQLVDDVLPKTPESDVAVGLRQLRRSIVQPEIALATRVTRDGKGALKLTTRNLTTVWLRMYRMDPMRDGGGEFWSQSLIGPRYDRIEAWMARTPVASWKLATGDKHDHMEIEHTVDAPAPDVGLYLVVVSGDDKFAYQHSMMRAAFANVTDVAIARADTGDAIRYYAFDVDGKAPAAGVPFRLLVSHDWRSRTPDEVKTGGDGVASWTVPHFPYLQVDAMAVHGKAIALFPSPAYRGERPHEPPLELFLVGDRPIYRPGQTAKLRVTSIKRKRDGSFEVDAGRKLHLVLNDPNGKDVWHTDVTTGAMGSAATEVAIPDKGLLGAYNVVATAPGVSDVSHWLGLRVEEYKRPEFEVVLDAPKTAAKYGEKARLTGHVKYYFGGAAGDVPVKFKVSRRRWIPWWYWRRGESPKVELTRGELKTDKTGAFTVEFTAAPDPDTVPSDDPDMPDVSDFIVEVEAHDTGGRTIQESRTMRVGAQSLLVGAEAARGFFFSDEKPELRVKATNLEEQPIATTLSWELERLGAPKDVPSASEPLQAVLKRYPAADAHVAHGSVALDGKAPAKLELGALPAGGYRVRLTGGGARGSFVFLVADKKSGALPSLPLPAMALVRDDEHQPGGKAELLVGSSAASGAYHFEIWRGSTLLDHRVERGAPVRVWTVPVGVREAGGFTARWIGVAGVEAVGGDASVNVPRKDKTLTVKLVGKPDALEPGQSATWTVEARDGKGRAVDGEALVTIFDRSLELYAKQSLAWASSLWAPPPPPESRSDGVQGGYGLSLPDDPAEQARIQREIQGRYKPKQTPRFSWEATQYGGYGYGAVATRHMAAVGGAPPPPMAAPAAPMKKGGRARAESANGDNDADGIVDVADKSVEQKEEGGERNKDKNAPPGDLRTNMAETAAFVPFVELHGGKGTFTFTAPERLTSWRVQLAALGRAVEAGTGEDTFATKKPLMVRVEIPRFFREGDRSTITAVVHNETEAPLTADVTLDVVDDVTLKDASAALGIGNRSARVTVAPHGLASAEFAMSAPENIATYKIRARAVAGQLHDAEERPLPILPSRERLVQSHVVALRGNDTKSITFDELLHKKDPSLRSESMTVSIDPTLALSVLRSIPYLVEYPYECVEQTLNRYVPLAIVNRIYAEHPDLAKAIAAAPHRETQYEPWNKDDPRRMMALTETPWLQEANGGARDERLRDLLNPKLVASMQQEALGKLSRAQNGSGAFPWFPGGRDDFYMTLYVLEQLAILQDFGVQPPRDVVGRALRYVENELPHRVKHDESNVAYLAYGAYVITSFDPQQYPEAGRMRGEVQKWMKYVLANRQILTPFGRAWCARVQFRLGDKKSAMELLESALDGARRDPVVGVYWTPERYSWLWYSDSVEKHAFFLRTLAELKPDDERVPGMLQWLLFNRKGNQWHSTKASAAAVYSILSLMRKEGSLTQPQKFTVTWDRQEEIVTVKPTEDRRAPLMWTVHGRDVTPARGTVAIAKQGPGVAFASATWIFSSTKLQAQHDSDLLSIERKYFKKEHRADGDHLVPLASGDRVHVGDEIEVRLSIRSKSQFEYVHVKEPRGAGFEETTLTSGWRWDKLAAYEEPRDSLFNFFVDWLPHGEFELRHSLRPTTPGRYRIGSAVLQSMYSPDVAAYSAGMELEVAR